MREKGQKMQTNHNQFTKPRVGTGANCNYQLHTHTACKNGSSVVKLGKTCRTLKTHMSTDLPRSIPELGRAQSAHGL